MRFCIEEERGVIRVVIYLVISELKLKYNTKLEAETKRFL